MRLEKGESNLVSMPCGAGTLEIEFDFIDHDLVARTSDGAVARLPLEPQTVADFYARYRLKNPARTRQLAEGIERVILELRPTFCRADWFAGFTPVVIRF